MTAGRPPKPNELKRALGNPGKRPLPELAVVHSLAPALSTPEPPADLGKAGLRLWERAWDAAIQWLSPQSDREAIENAARLADVAELARSKYLATHEAADARAFVAVNKAFTDALSSLGFDPTSRSKLGVAEIKAVSALDKLVAKREARANK